MLLVGVTVFSLSDRLTSATIFHMKIYGRLSPFSISLSLSPLKKIEPWNFFSQPAKKTFPSLQNRNLEWLLVSPSRQGEQKKWSHIPFREPTQIIRVARWHIFKPEFPIWVNFEDVGIFCGHLVYILHIWPSGIFCGHLVYIFYAHLVYFVVIWYIFWYVAPRTIWQTLQITLQLLALTL
jgi:hypothetical protein